MFNVGGKIRKIRLERGLDQTTLAERAGVSQAYISQVERGLETPSIECLFAIASALNVPVTIFFEDNAVSLNDPAILEHFDDETKHFLAKEESVPYVIFAKDLKEEGITIEDIESIREAIKTILQLKRKKE